VAYGSKAFLCTAMAKLVGEEDLHLDVATGGELHVALAAGFPPERLVLHGNNKSLDELKAALAAGVGRIVVDSFDEIERLERLGGRPRVLVRVTPGVEAHTHEYVRTGQADSKFGFGVANGAAAKAVDWLASSPAVELAGIHAHIGSQIFLLSSFVKAVEVIAEFFVPLGLPELCLGGGLGVPYVEGEEAPSIAEWAGVLRAACRDAGVAEGTRVSVEPGRAIVAAAALTLYRV